MKQFTHCAFITTYVGSYLLHEVGIGLRVKALKCAQPSFAPSPIVVDSCRLYFSAAFVLWAASEIVDITLYH